MVIVGIAGSIAGGKSTVAARLADLGGAWINADLIARGVLDREAVRAALRDRFGPSISTAEGSIDRDKLSAIVFGDDPASAAALSWLEATVHPPTRCQILADLRAAHADGHDLAILDVPLLFQSGWDRSCDEIVCVDADLPIRLARAAARGWDDHELTRRERRQTSIERKRRLATWLIENNGSLAELHYRVDGLNERWRRRVKRTREIALTDAFDDRSHCYQ